MGFMMQRESEPALLDTLARPLRDLRISVMDRCNFRCTYCMPREKYDNNYRFLKNTERLSLAELVRVANLFAQLGVRKLRVTGGEPLLFPQLAELIQALRGLPGIEDIALTTNGSLLAAQAEALRVAGLGRITVSLDSLDPQVFRTMNGGVGSVDNVLAGIESARRAGFGPIKLNTVVQRGVNDHTLFDLIERFRGTDVIVRFIEYMDVGNRNQWHDGMVVPSRELVSRISARWPLTALERVSHADVAERYALTDGSGELGFISAVTQPFCGQCSRARLSSDGSLYTCLFASQGLDLRAQLRGGASDSELSQQIRAAWQHRSDRYSEQRIRLRRSLTKRSKVEMNYIGG
jgi:cyclic pyranopterin phosphate synthase